MRLILPDRAALLLVGALMAPVARAAPVLCVPPEVDARAALTAVPDDELLARLVLAESTSTGFPDDPAIARALAWLVVNRVRLSDASPTAARLLGRGVAGVIFQPAQFNPAVSPRSRFSALFRCPADDARWGTALSAAREALARRGGGATPVSYARSAWERDHGLDLVVNVYYPASVQAQGALAPWEGQGPVLVSDLTVDGVALPVARVRFYRRAAPYSDVTAPAARP